MEENIQSINNSGLVLLWPFYLHYFQTLGLVKGNKFVSAKGARRAAKLMEYLATGGDDTSGSDKPLNMILCNIAEGGLPPQAIAITEQERKLSDELLRAAVDRWSILENMDEHGFREAYMQRKGKLYTSEDKIMLEVEPRSIDVLMDQLPWSIVSVRLSWMGKPIFVKWR